MSWLKTIYGVELGKRTTFLFSFNHSPFTNKERRMQEDINEKINLLKKTPATTKIRVITTRYKGPESCGLRKNKENKMAKKPLPQYRDFCRRLHQPEDKDKMVEKILSPNHVIERENKGKKKTSRTTEPPRLQNSRFPQTTTKGEQG